MEDGFPDDDRGEQGLAGLGSPHCFPHQNGERVERYSRKVFVGGLPPDIDEGKLVALTIKGISNFFGYDLNLKRWVTSSSTLLHHWDVLPVAKHPNVH